MNHAQHRFDIFKLINSVRFLIESFYAKQLNEKCGEKYHGKFYVDLTNPNAITHKVLNRFCVNGSVCFVADDPLLYGSLKAFRTDDGAIDLSKMHITTACPDHIGSEEWTLHSVMLKDVFAMLRKYGIVPMQQLVADTQRSFGYGAPKINKKFGGECELQEASDHTEMEVMQKLIENFNAQYKEAA